MRNGDGRSSEIIGAGGEAVFVGHDLGDAGNSSQLIEGAIGAFGRVDNLVNNGGTLMATPTPEVDVETFDWASRPKVRSAFLLTGAVPRMMRQGLLRPGAPSGQDFEWAADPLGGQGRGPHPRSGSTAPSADRCVI